jgi:hypothetical protein
MSFDHVYSGRYKLKIDSCSSVKICPKTVFEQVIDHLTTPLINLNVFNMGMNVILNTTHQ